MLLFSPRMRGCFSSWLHSEQHKPLFPAHAGVFLRGFLCTGFHWAFPRACGGVSHDIDANGALSVFSPRMRGCFRSWISFAHARVLFPAHAGVFPSSISIVAPRMRGCFHPMPRNCPAVLLFPAHAGVFPRPNLATSS